MSTIPSRTLLAVVTAFGVCLTAIAAPAAALAEPLTPSSVGVSEVSAGSGFVVDDAPVAETPEMGEYAAENYLSAASALPSELVAALESDLGLTPSEYLAQSDAAVDAGDVLDYLSTLGVPTDDAVLEGTELTVLVDDEAQAEAVAAVGATAVFEPIEGMGADFSDVTFTAAADLVGGTGWTYDVGDRNGDGKSDGYSLCSVGFNGRATSNGAHQFATAGHCLDGQSTDSTPLYALTQSKPADSLTDVGTHLGSRVPGTVKYGSNVDSARVAVAAGWTPKPTVSTWGGGKGAPTAGTPVTVRGATPGVVGAKLCKSGRTTGWTCGTVQGFQTVEVGGRTVNSVVANVCAIPGDSGGAALVGNYAVGITSGSNASDTACATKPLAAFFAMSSSRGQDVLEYNAGWQLSVAVNTPTVNAPSYNRVFAGGSLAGSVAQAPSGTVVSLYVDGSTTATSTSKLTKTGGGFSLPLTGVAAGAHKWSIVAGYGKYSKSSAATGTVTVLATPKVDRLAGADRYSTAIAISKAAFPTTAPIVYVAAGDGFADALGAAPAAAKGGGPLLLTPKSSAPAALLTELKRLKPQKIIVVGGTGVVSSSTASAFGKIAPVTRLGGADRYATSRKVVDYAFPSATTAVYVASGANFPDALGASAASARYSSPVVLTPGKSLDSATNALVKRLGASKIRVVGGKSMISDSVLNALKGYASDTKRVSGSDRFGTGLAINKDAFSSSRRVFVANGMNFPDALAGAAFAGGVKAPLVLSPATCLADGTRNELLRLGASQVTLLGSNGVLNGNVATLREC
ncbi:cell wall-binding repeat-containing protein [Agromyces italicus]|uniref:cell wall-binding repeat-containing protein n=1 Tax=Agromyces italicus TaxID=279572 RepID=UPI000410ADA1|nr:cell wall-binding repeat-containing protein [Agromyces italicus]